MEKTVPVVKIPKLLICMHNTSESPKRNLESANNGYIWEVELLVSFAFLCLFSQVFCSIYHDDKKKIGNTGNCISYSA